MTATDIKLGTDLVYLPRLAKIYNRFGLRFFQKLLTKSELAYCFDSPLLHKSLARAGARIAVKEAVSKALGSGLNGLGWARGIQWQDIETLSAENTQPVLLLSGKAKALSDTQHITRWRISLTHDGDYALATVLGIA